MGKHWDNTYDSGQTPWVGIAPWLKRLIKETNTNRNPAPSVALDLGSGTGDKSLWLAKHGYEVIGVDISEVAIRQAMAARGDSTNPRFVNSDLADISSLSLAPKSVGLIVDLVSSQFLSATNQRSLWKHLGALLSPKGLVVHTRLEPAGKKAPEWVQKLGVQPADFEQMVSNFTTTAHVSTPSRNLPDTRIHRYLLTI